MNQISAVNIKKSFGAQKSSKSTPFAGQTKLKNATDTFAKAEQGNAKNDGKFTWGEAFKNFGKGLISPITTIIKHPIATLATLAGAGALCFVFPVLTPILTVGFGALSVFQLAKSTVSTIKDYSKGNYDNAEKGFKGIGEGVVGAATTLLGLKSSAKIAAEAKAISAKGVKALDTATKEQIAFNVSKGGFKGAVREHLSLFFSKSGRKAVINQFKPSVIKDRFTGLFKGFKTQIEEPISHSEQIERFKKSPEGKRRANLTDEQISAEIKNKFDQAFDEIGVQKEQRPKLVIKNAKENYGGSYNPSSHKLEINPKAYKAGIFEIDDVVMHEATHCKEAIFRASLPKENAEKVVADDLIARITNGENEEILIKGNFLGPDMMKPPKMSEGMKQDFIQFAKQYLYKTDDTFSTDFNSYMNKKSYIDNKLSLTPQAKRVEEAEKAAEKITAFLDDLNALLDKHPEFVKEFKSREEAALMLEKYALSHNNRFRYFTDNAIKGIAPETLTPEQIKLAENSLRGHIDTVEGNAANAGWNNLFGDKGKFNQYQFSPEEVLAQQNGNNFMIKNYKLKLEELKQSGALTPDMEAHLTSAIQRAEATIAYKTKGLEYYNAYRQLLNNPADELLSKQVATLEAELKVLENALTPKDIIEIHQFIKQTWGIPLNTLPANAIIHE